MTASIEAIGRAVREVAASRPAILGVYLFGSQAAGWDSAGSDVDLGVLFARRPTLDDLLTLQDRFERALGRPVDVVDAGSCDPFLALEIVRGERVHEADGLRCDEFDLFVLRRAGDLAPFERARRRSLLSREIPGAEPGSA